MSHSPSLPTRASNAADNYRALFENMSEGYVVCEAIRSANGQLVDYWIRAANPVFLKRAPAGDTMINRRQLEVRPDTSQRWFEACERALGRVPVRFEFRDPMTGRWYEVHMARLSESEVGQFFVDVTERKAVEERVTQLFDELNHRVKNNLAVASSILELQARASPSNVQSHLRKAIDRLHSIADLHTTLYKQSSRDTADLRPYLENLCERLSRSLFDEGRVRIEVDCQSVAVLVDQAVGIGLIVNELVTNAAKHAFKDQVQGFIRVALSSTDEALHLLVADNGCGLPSPAGPASSEGLGLRLVRSLTDGQGGDLRVESAGGAIFHLRLPRRSVAAAPDFQPRLL